MAAYWQHLSWVAYVAVVVGTWKYLPLALLRLVAAFTRDDRRHRQSIEVLWLARRDGKRAPMCSACRESPDGDVTTMQPDALEVQSRMASPEKDRQ